MPQGKGTYGSQVGRPSKKKYDEGGNVDPFSTKNPEGVPVQQVAEGMEKQSMTKNMEDAIPTTNAMERSQVSPDTTEYKEGGFVKKAVEKIKDKRRMKKLEKSLKEPNTPKGHQKSERELAHLKQKGKEPTHKITGITKPKKKGLKPAVVPSNPPLVKGDTAKEKIKTVAREAIDLGSLGLTIGITKKKKGKKK